MGSGQSATHLNLQVHLRSSCPTGTTHMRGGAGYLGITGGGMLGDASGR